MVSSRVVMTRIVGGTTRGYQGQRSLLFWDLRPAGSASGRAPAGPVGQVIDLQPAPVTKPIPDRRDALLEAGLALASELSLSSVLTRIVAVACELTSARYGALGVVGRQGTLVDFITHGLSQAQRRQIGALPSGRGILGLLIEDPRPVRVPNISQDPRALGFPPHHPAMTSFLGAPVMARGRVFGNIYLTEKEGAPEFSADDEYTLTVLASQAGVAIANASLYEEVLSRERWLAAAQTITGATMGGAQIEQILTLVAERARRLLDSESAVVALASSADHDPLLHIAAASGLGAARLRGQPLLPLGGPAYQAARTGHPVLAQSAPGLAQHPGPRGRTGRNRTAVFASLVGREGNLGVLGVVGRPRRPPPSTEAVHMVESFAAQAALSLDYVRTQGELQRLALLDERERIAKELHDGVIQSLFAVGMGLQAISPSAEPSAVEGHIERAVGELDRVIIDLRNYIFALRPGILAGRQLGEAVRLLVLEFEARCAIATSTQIDDAVAVRLSRRASDLVQLTREALSNISRHSRAHGCRIRLRRFGGWAILTVEDDGVGFLPEEASLKGQGLRNMEERVATLGGRMSIKSGPHQGTRLAMIVPLD